MAFSIVAPSPPTCGCDTKKSCIRNIIIISQKNLHLPPISGRWILSGTPDLGSCQRKLDLYLLTIAENEETPAGIKQSGNAKVTFNDEAYFKKVKSLKSHKTGQEVFITMIKISVSHGRTRGILRLLCLKKW